MAQKTETKKADKVITIPTDALVEAWNLLGRFQKSDVFRQYVEDRLRLVIPALAVYAVLVIAAVSATAIFISGSGAGFVLPAFILAPFLLAGSLCVAAYLFFAWLEGRALRHSLHHEPLHGLMPRIPWAYVAVFLAVPALVLLFVWWKTALFLIALGVATPFVFARLDRS
jgi:hypothetical protein